ncbi:Tyrosine-protein kinase Wzc [Serinicoccus hydrothermalis]|uniref:non-specific protein-tyrosine kinase n=1 Tax=Serinicoccus hydrothermalis TaxID=1758689 RepID=A0A1B1NED9_9MICO|nr:polysaccharide biosynthesis tyrosine autokinase [Serinicoccus hydrothermalis]ANS79808.1 Tyrosine-protein kinase Wzc [Serinicoccus hydrothermalis]
MELTDYLHLVRRQWRLIVGVSLAVLLVTAAITALTTPQYRAQAQVFVSTSGGDTATDLAQGSNFAQRQVATYADIVTTPIVLDTVAEEFGLDGSAALSARTTAQVPAGTVLINLSVTDEDPQTAAELTNAVAQQFSQTVQDLERVEASGDSPVKATVVQPAAVPGAAATPDVPRNLLLGAVLGLLLGLGAGVLRDVLDARVTGETDVQRVTEEPIVGAIAYDKEALEHPLVVEIDPHSPRAEAFRTLRTNLRYIDADNQPKTMVFTSTIPGEGKSTTTANLALTLAQSGSSVCLVEGDLRRPRLLDYLGLENAAGMTDVLVGRADLDDVLQPWGDSLWVLGCGPIPPNPSELLGSAAMTRLIETLEGRFDYVIIDSPPLLAVTDAAILSTQADGVIVVVGTKLVRRDQLDRALGSLRKVDANVLGLVLNRLPTKGPDAYSYAYESYQADAALEAQGKRAKSRRARRKSKQSS